MTCEATSPSGGSDSIKITGSTQPTVDLSCGGHPDPDGVCAVKGRTEEELASCSHEHPALSRWNIPSRPASQDFPEPPERLHRRFDRIARLLGDDPMQRLARSHVVVFGMGGVGSFAVEGLVRSGVGRLTLVDFDDVCITNFNRQLHALRATIGKPKVELMADRVRMISADVWVEAIRAFYEAETSEQLLTPTPDFVVDCIDNVTAKLHLLATCYHKRIPVVSSMGAAAKLDPTRVRVADLSETHTDPLAKSIRKNLGRVYDIDCTKPLGIPAIFSDEVPLLPSGLRYDEEVGGFLCVCPHRADSPHSCEKRNVIHGTAVFVTSVFGMTAASVVVRTLAAHPIQPLAEV